MDFKASYLYICFAYGILRIHQKNQVSIVSNLFFFSYCQTFTTKMLHNIPTLLWLFIHEMFISLSKYSCLAEDISFWNIYFLILMRLCISVPKHKSIGFQDCYIETKTVNPVKSFMNYKTHGSLNFTNICYISMWITSRNTRRSKLVLMSMR